ncbi:MAG: HAMP domain-containing histidine kinase [Spirochaetales bacterium]|nr:HAMP domain-containing histidine kinase [Spirochaetales bacterium]
MTEGTGLGLSVVHGIVRKHGGSILFTTGTGEGSEFVVLLSLFRENDRDS